jgi:transposase-like protein
MDVQIPAPFVQMAPLRASGNYLCGRLVPPFFPFLRNVEELLTERGLGADHTTIWRWVQRYAPVLDQRCRRELKPANGSWRVDETYVRVKGKWAYLYERHD